MKRTLLFILCCILFVFTMFCSIVTIFNVANYEGIDFNQDINPVDSIYLRSTYRSDLYNIVHEVTENTDHNYYSNLFWKVTDNQTGEIVKLNPNFSQDVADTQLQKVYTLNLKTGVETVDNQISSPNYPQTTGDDQTLLIAYDTQSTVYKDGVKTFEMFDSMKWMIWGLIGWPILLIIWAWLLIAHYKETKESFITKIPTELLFLGFGGMIMILLVTAGNIRMPYFDYYYANPNQYLVSSIVIILLTLIAAILMTLSVMALLSKIKTKTLFKNSITGKLLSASSNMVKTLPDNRKLIIYILAWLFLHIFLLSFRNPLILLFLIGLNIYLISKVLELNNQKHNIEQHLSLLRKGEIETPLDKRDYFELYHQGIDDINNLQEGLQAAVEKSLVDERMSIDLITNVSHDLKTPLTTIINYTDFLIEGVNPEKHDEYLRVIKEKSLRLSELATSVVEASKASSGKLDVHMMDLNALELLNQVLVDHQEPFMNKNLVLLVDENSLNHMVQADSQKLYRVYENLFKNIEKYAQENSRVYVSGTNKNDTLEISFKNVSKYALGSEDLTARFVQGDVSRQTEGSGLGLAIAKDLMKLMNGDLVIDIDGDLFKVILTLNKVNL